MHSVSTDLFAQGAKGRLRLWTNFSFSLVICVCCILCEPRLKQQHTGDSSRVTIEGGGGVTLATTKNR